MGLAAALALAAVAGVAARLWFRSQTGSVAAPADSVATMDPVEALRRGVALELGRRHFESLPYFRRAASASDGWVVHWDLATALNNAAFEIASRRGVAMAASRSAIERVDLTQQALAEVGVAEREAPEPRTHAALELVRGQTLELWGFPLDALEIYRSAARIDSTFAAARRKEAECRARLPGGPAPRAPAAPAPEPH